MNKPIENALFKKTAKNQSGFIVLLGMLMLVVGASVWFGNVGNLRTEMMAIKQVNEQGRELQQVKDKMLAYAVFQPELFGTLSGTSTLQTSEKVPGPGYFPCPDATGDGESNAPCGSGSSVIIGRVPIQISSRFFGFLNQVTVKDSFWYAVDTRFLVQNTDYNNFGATAEVKSRRYAPLNVDDPVLASLTLDGVTDIVMVLFHAGDALSGQDRSSSAVSNYLEDENNDGDTAFITYHSTARFNDTVIAITREEWNAAMLARVSQDINPVDNTPDLCAIPATDPHWFNACNNVYKTGSDGANCASDGSGMDNQLGQDWRSVLGCPP